MNSGSKSQPEPAYRTNGEACTSCNSVILRQSEVRGVGE